MPPDRPSPTFAAFADPTSYLQVGDGRHATRTSELERRLRTARRICGNTL